MHLWVLWRFLLIPPALVLANFLGYAYAHFAGPLRAKQNPLRLEDVAPPPLLPEYGAYFQRVVRGDFGTMPYAAGRDTIAATLGHAVLASLGLIIPALAISVLVGVWLGRRAVRPDPPRVSPWLTSIATLGLAMPGFYLGSLVIAGIVALIVFGLFTRPPFPVGGFGWDSHLLLPLVVLVLRPTMQIAQVTAALLAAELGKQYVVAARSVGHSWRAIFSRYALRNILAAVVVTIAGSLRLLTGELIVVERLFEWPGVGRLVAQTLVPAHLSGARESLQFLNPAILAALLTVLTALFLVTDLLTAVLVRRYDPRVRSSEG